jgi:ABC-2 type transport system ATP-binding protein
MKNETVIEVKDLYKKYGKTNAVDGISIKVKRGEVFAFLGPNGAGKTTTVEIIEGIRTATKGKVELLGIDITKNSEKLKSRIGVLPQEFSSFDMVTVKETIAFFSSLYSKHKNIEEMMVLLGLKEHSKKLYKTLSGGLKQKVGIAVALVNDPEVVFLDEPTTGLDPLSRQEVWKIISGLKKEGKTVFLTTHYMEEAEELADHVAIISHGKLIAEGTVDQLIDMYGKGSVLAFTGAPKKMALFLKQNHNAEVKGDQVSIALKDSSSVLGLLKELEGAGYKYKGFVLRRSNLEEVFIALTGESLKQEAQKK